MRFRAPRSTPGSIHRADTATPRRGRRTALLATVAGAAAVALLPVGATGAAASTPQAAAITPTVATAPVAAQAARSAAVTNAMSKLGAPYRWGATGPNAFDCSGLVHWAFAAEGVNLPRTSRAMSGVGTPVAKSDLQPGDLVFFYRPVSHVGIYIGDGQMVHASTSGKPVQVASIDNRPFHSARRV